MVFKGKKDRITVVLDKDSNFRELKENLRDKVSGAGNFFGGSKMAVDFKGKELTSSEEEELLKIISESSGTDTANASRQATRSKIARSKTETIDISQIQTDLFVRQGSALENGVIFHKGALRSGQKIRYEGSVVVIGDINPGAEIIADGNVVVYGSVKGLIHAGYLGNRECFITALEFRPVQLRIADIITYFPDSYFTRARKKINPSYAYVDNEQIFIVPLV